MQRVIFLFVYSTALDKLNSMNFDGFPYYSEQLQNLSGQLYTLASVYYDGEFDKTYRFGVNVENQIIFYHFNYELEFERMFWISQNITMVRR